MPLKNPFVAKEPAIKGKCFPNLILSFHKHNLPPSRSSPNPKSHSANVVLLPSTSCSAHPQSRTCCLITLSH